MNQDNQNKTRKRIVTTKGAEVIENGKMPPQNVEIEEAVLGAMLLEKKSIGPVSLILTPESFYKEQNGRVFKAIIALNKRGEPSDILTVTQELKATGDLDFVGGSYAVAKLTNRIASSANIEFHARIVQQCFISREIIRISVHSIGKAYEHGTDCFELIDDLHLQLRSLTKFTRTRIKKVDELFSEMIKGIITANESEKQVSGVPSGFDSIDRETGGWQRGDLTILAARPSMGKTAFALALAKNAAVTFKKPTAIFSLEMTAIQLTGRLSASEADVSSTRINHKSINASELQDLGGKCSKLIDSPLYIDDSPSLTIEQLRTLAIQMKQDFNIELIIIDYLQLIKGSTKGGNRESDISHISRNLKILAKELDVPVIALSQLSRQVESRDKGPDAKRPQLSDLRESGAIEQDADNVMFLFRPEYYELFPDGYNYKGRTISSKNLMLVDFAKGRNFDLFEAALLFYGVFMKVNNYEFDLNIEEAVIIKDEGRLLSGGDISQD